MPLLKSRTSGRKIRRRGVAYVLMALLTTPLLGAVGLAIDLGAAQIVNVRLQAARAVAETSTDLLLARSALSCTELRARAQGRADHLRSVTVGGARAFGANISPAIAACDGPADMRLSLGARYQRSFITLVTGGEAGTSDALVGSPAKFVSVWDTDNPGASADNQIVLPLTIGGDDRMRVDWGDGTISRIDAVTSAADVTHTYASPGVYTVTVRGQIDGVGFNGVSSDPAKLIEVRAWGSAKIADGGGQFQGTANLAITAGDTPNLSGVFDARDMFRNSGITGGLAGWDTAHLRTLRGMFSGASQFDGNIGGWDVSGAYDMTAMFENATAFDQDLSSWCVERIEARPAGFDTGASAWTASRPAWGASCL